MNLVRVYIMLNRDRKNNLDLFDATSRWPLAIDPDILGSGDIFAVLAHPRRRFLLSVLAIDDQWSLPALATALAAWEHDIDESAVDDRMHDRMYVSLYHTHIPQLEEEGVIQFDEYDEMITPGAHTEDLLAVLDDVSTRLEQRHDAHTEGRGWEN